MLDRWMDDEDTTMSFLLGKIYFLITAFFIVFFGIQTYLLVIHALPHDVDWMQDATVFSFDGMGLLYFLAINFYRTQKGVSKFRNPNSLRACWIMFIVCMAGSLLCTVAYMSLDSNHFNWDLLPWWLSIGVNILVSLIFGIHCIVGYYIGHQESEAKRTANKNSFLAPLPQPTIQELAISMGVPEAALRRVLLQAKNDEVDRLLAANNNSPTTGEIDAALLQKKKQQ